MGIRFIWLLCSIALVLSTSLALAVDDDSARIAIIDASERTDNYLNTFKEAGVLVIGRYLARCKQWDGKRIVDNKDELKHILDNEFGILSIYQYNNDSLLKFSGRKSRVYKRVYDSKEDPSGALAKRRDAECPLNAWPVGRRGDDKYEIEVSLPDKDCQAPVIHNCEGIDPKHTGKAEAAWDAEAALNQARDIGQPAGTAIYFGVDFNVVLKSEPSLRQALINYFTVISDALRRHPNHYLVGAYGNGAALELLHRTKIVGGPFDGRSLIDLTWFNASPGHDRTAIVYNGDDVEGDAKFDWDLFQSRVAIDYPAESNGMSVDLNVQNKKNASKYIGFWKRSGGYQVPEKRTATIFDQRRFVCNGMSIIRSSPGSEAAEGLFCGRKTDDKYRVKQFGCNNDGVYPSDGRSRICFGAVTRVREEDGNFLRVDCDEDGIFEAWTASDNLGLTMARRPIWAHGNAERRGMTRDRTTCEK